MRGKSKIKQKSKEKAESAPPEETKPSPNEAFPVVGFGASAGGLEAFDQLLRHLPKDPGMALVLVQHLDPKHSSILTEILSRSTPMPVRQAEEGLRVEADHVYVIPPNKNLKIAGGALRLEPRPPVGTHLPIDCFFSSLAQDVGSKAIGVVLSGTASDGTLGLKAIKAEGGITFAQDAGSARYDGMPQSAVAAGCVDFVLSPADIAHELLALCRHPYLKGEADAAPAKEEEDQPFQEIFGMLRSATGVDFSYYKPGTIRRRTLRRMALHKLKNIGQYVKFLQANQGELQSLFQDILIHVTGFFREPSTFETIKTGVLPILLKDRSPAEPVRIWVPGCSSGEEVYSIAMCLLEYMREAGLEMQIQIFGTDLSDSALEKARLGVYPETIAADVSNERLRRFFLPVDGHFQIARSVRDACVFARQNVVKDPPFSRMDLILCRNLLIYLGPVLQLTVLRLFHYGLRPNGFLVLGHSETVGHADDLFELLDKRSKIYARKPAAESILRTDLGTYAETASQPAGAHKKNKADRAADVQRKIDQVILARYSPSAVVVDSNLRILEFRGKTSPLLEHPSGEATLDVKTMTRGNLGLEIRNLVRKTQVKGAPVRSGPIPVAAKDGIRNVRIAVSPLEAQVGQPHYLVVFEDAGQATNATGAGTKPGRGDAGAADAGDLRQELATTKEYLQTVIEEQESTNEELKSAHEEVQSANEELQSTNEELLTAKEELQSTNEELTTVNEEMQTRNAELQRANYEVMNLLNSAGLPMVMLGTDLRIRRFTPQAEKMLNLVPADMGRAIGDFHLKIDVPDLPALCQDVIDDLTARQREVKDADGRRYAMAVRPYRTAEDRIDGVVLSLFDVTERKHSAEARYRRLFEAAAEGIIIADALSGEILDVNPFVVRVFGYSRGRLTGAKFWESELFAGTAINESILARLLESESLQMSLSLRTKSGDEIEAEAVCSLFDEGESKIIQFNIRDVTAREQWKDQWRREEAQNRQAQKMEAVGRLAGGVAHDFNNLLMAILGYSDLLRREIADQEGAAEMLAQIRGAGERAALLTKQLLAFGRKQILNPAVLDLNLVVGEMRQLIQVMMNDETEMRLDLGRELGRIRADRGQVEQVILNLVLNARDAMPTGGLIVVSTGNVTVDQAFSDQHPAVPAGEYVTLSVKDNGTGMDEETQSHLFEPFFTTKAKGKGAGLGLSTTYNIVRESGGYIWAYSELRVGTTFTVYLPRVPAGGPAELETAAANDLQGTETILVVEDEPAVRAVARLFLEQRGYKILDASSGREALRIAKEYKGRIHLMLTDVVMPQMSGRELAFQLAPKRPEMKVVYMSGHTEDAISHHGVLEDRVAFLQKPFTQTALAAKIREVLDRED